jgi:hypothetical protein
MTRKLSLAGGALCLAAVVLAAPSVGAAQDLASARTFVEGLYSAYHGDGPDYLGRQASQVFAPGLLALVRLDKARTPHGDVGALDGDPICDCQDFEITKVVVTVEAAGPGRAAARAQFRNFGQPQTVRLDLLAVPGGWRIADVHTADMPSMARFLRRHAGGR